MAQWRAVAQTKLAECVVLIVDPGKSEAKLAALIGSTSIGKERGNCLGHVLIHYDTSLNCEGVTAPHLRSAPFRNDHISKFVHAITSCRKDPDGICKLAPGDVFVFHDAGKPSNSEYVNKLMVREKGRFGVVAKSENMQRLQVNILLSEETLKLRRALTRGVGSLKQLTTLNIYHNSSSVLPEKKRVSYPGTNLGSVLGPVDYDTWEDAWKLTLDGKKALYGEHRKQVGGRSDGTEAGDDDDDTGADADLEQAECPTFQQPLVGAGRGHGGRPGGSVEPAFWFQFPEIFYRELYSSYFARKVIDVTPGSGVAALAALFLQLGYLGICFSEDHRRLLTENLVDKVLVMMRTENHPLYRPDFQKWWHSQQSNEGSGAAPAAAPAAKKNKTGAPNQDAANQEDPAAPNQEDPAAPPKPPGAAPQGSLASLLAGMPDV